MTEKTPTVSSSGEIIEKIDLPNGLSVEFFDYSRGIAGDRWFVGLLARMPVPVRPEYFENRPPGSASFEEFTRACGREIDFELRKGRNFVDAQQKVEVLNGLLTRLKEHLLYYMGHPDFAAGFVRRKVNEYEERRNWWREGP